MLHWEKQGLIFKPSGSRSWNKSHAQVPTVDASDERRWRIYYATRDTKNRSLTSYFEVEAGNPRNVLYAHDEPILGLGRLGAFDDCGVMPSWIVTVGDVKYLYYIGWAVRTTVPYHNSIGLAISRDGGRSFERFSEGPLFGSTHSEPYFTGTSCVLVEQGRWRNWYLSCTRWELIDGKAEPFYHIKYAESKDGVNWDRRGAVAIDYKSEHEGGLVKASVLPGQDRYRMWYAYRRGRDYRTNPNNSYRIGYAESPDGVAWTRLDDQVSMDVSNEGWDSQMVCYPHVVPWRGRLFMFYNGNGFGSSGVGCAVAEFGDADG